MDPLGDKWNKIVDVYFVHNDIHYALELLLQRIDQLMYTLIIYLHLARHLRKSHSF